MRDLQNVRRGLVTAATAAALAAVTIAAPAAPAAAAGPGADAYQAVLARRAPAVVTVRYVLKIELGGTMGGAMGGEGQESEGEISGVVVDPGGLVLCSNTLLGGFASLLGRLMGGSDFEISATPEDIEVLIGDSTQGLPARLVARDSDLDLAWVQIDDPPEGLAAVDLGAGVPAKVGEPFVAVRRMDKIFARAPALIEGRIGGETTKPRRLWVPAASPFGGHGLPVFNADGALLGVTVMQFPDTEDAGGAGPMASLMQSARLEEVLSAVILPAREVERATALAREMAAERAASGEAEEGEHAEESDLAEESEAEAEPRAEPEDGDADAEPAPDTEPDPGDGDPSAHSAPAPGATAAAPAG